MACLMGGLGEELGSNLSGFLSFVLFLNSF